MPEVGKKKFPYTKAGKKAAKAYAKKSGQDVEKYQYGGSVDPFSTRNPSGVPAEQVKEATEKQNMSKNILNAIPTTDAQDRSEVSPDTTEYKEGGFIKGVVEKYKSKKAGKKK